MKIYFAGSIRGGRDDAHLYLNIIKMLSEYGEVLTEHIGKKSLLEEGEKISDEEIYNRDMKWLSICDIVVAEVTNPSLGVGYEIAKAQDMNKKILCLFREGADKRLSAMINGDKKLNIENYKTIEDVKNGLDKFFNK